LTRVVRQALQRADSERKREGEQDRYIREHQESQTTPRRTREAERIHKELEKNDSLREGPTPPTGTMTGWLSTQHTLSRFTKAAGTAGLHHAHPGFERFMAAHPLISRFTTEHPKATALVFRVAHHIPILDRYVPIAPVFERRAPPRPRQRPRM
jgi:hypothetical protein